MAPTSSTDTKKNLFVIMERRSLHEYRDSAQKFTLGPYFKFAKDIGKFIFVVRKDLEVFQMSNLLFLFLFPLFTNAHSFLFFL